VGEGDLSYERCAAEFAAETARLGAAVTALEPDALVPTCPEWTVRDLVGHVGAGHRWSAGIVEDRLAAPPPLLRADPPADQDAWPGWLRDGADRLAAAVRAAGSEAPVWTWRSPHNAGFWLRKMLHDEVVHRADVELAAGMPFAVAGDVATDGISDFLDTVAALSKSDAEDPIFTGLTALGATLHLHGTDGEPDSEWLVEATPEGVTWRHGHAKADVAVRGPAPDLLLVMNRRLPPSAVEVIGDRDLLARWLDHSRF
jgi:uncharacterized protein (TIGR03083 family)